jgi:DivIVA domain-containing protein
MSEGAETKPDRERIVRRDFPLGRRGYDVEAVDAHLAAIADAIEQEAADAARRRADIPLDQVRAIVDAAERSGAELQQAAEQRAAALRAAVARDREQALRQANADADAHVGFVSEAGAAMLERVEALERELEGLMQSLRSGAGRVEANLSALERRLEELSATARRPERAQAPATAPAAPRAEEPATGPGGDRAEPAADDAAQRAPGSAGEPGFERTEPALRESQRAEDVASARLVALNMALTGASLEDTDRYLADNFDLPDRAELLREVYDSVRR